MGVLPFLFTVCVLRAKMAPGRSLLPWYVPHRARELERPLRLDGFKWSGADFPERYKPYFMTRTRLSPVRTGSS
jgi:hypothetical protein